MAPKSLTFVRVGPQNTPGIVLAAIYSIRITGDCRYPLQTVKGDRQGQQEFCVASPASFSAHGNRSLNSPYTGKGCATRTNNEPSRGTMIKKFFSNVMLSIVMDKSAKEKFHAVR